MLSKIIDHRSTADAVPLSEGTFVNQFGVKRRKATTRGWELLVEQKDGWSDWIALINLKESYPLEIPIYATNQGMIIDQLLPGGYRMCSRNRSESLRK